METKFNKDEKIIPRDGKHPTDTLVVYEHTDEELKACPLGGGFVYRFSPAKQEKYQFRAVSEEELNSHRFYKALFYICDDQEPYYEGWTTGQRWNGWATPSFPRDSVEKLISNDDHGKYWWDGDTILHTFPEDDPDDGPESWEPSEIDTPEGKIKVWGVGSWSWTWMEKAIPE